MRTDHLGYVLCPMPIIRWEELEDTAEFEMRLHPCGQTLHLEHETSQGINLESPDGEFTPSDAWVVSWQVTCGEHVLLTSSDPDGMGNPEPFRLAALQMFLDGLASEMALRLEEREREQPT